MGQHNILSAGGTFGRLAHIAQSRTWGAAVHLCRVGQHGIMLNGGTSPPMGRHNMLLAGGTTFMWAHCMSVTFRRLARIETVM